MRPPGKPEVPCLAAYPYVVVRIACPHCPNRSGSYRLARLAAKMGPETPLAEVLRRVALDCPWLDERRPRTGSKYVPRCKVHFPDLEEVSPPPPDLPPGMMKLRVVQGGKA